MANTGEKKPGAATSVDRAGSTAWTNANNALSASDSLAASAGVPTDYLILTDFAFSIPASASILGVTLKVASWETGTGNSSFIPQLITDTTPTLIGTAKTAVTVSGATPVTSTDGGATDLWSATAALTVSAINNAGFGVALWSTDTVNTLHIDLAVMQIDYSLGPTTLTFTGKVSDEGFGSATLRTRITVTPSGKATDEGFGTVSLSSVSTSGDLHYVVYASALGAPSAAQVKAGQDVNGEPSGAPVPLRHVRETGGRLSAVEKT